MTADVLQSITLSGQVFPNGAQSMIVTGHKTRDAFDYYNIIRMGDLEEAARWVDEMDSGANDYKVNYNLRNSGARSVLSTRFFHAGP
jgi:hypothetical protein